MRVDLHVHTYHSSDSLSQPAAILRCMDRNGVDVVAITDHNAIDGAREVAALAPGRVIVGEEIRTSQGEIIGLFLKDLIAPGLSPRETVAAIHAQGGLVYVPHPVDRIRGSTLRRDALLSIIPWIDVLEVYNARVFCSTRNRMAREIAEAHRLPMGAGSDAHSAADIGLATVEMASFSDSAGFMRAIHDGRITGRLTGLVGRLSGLTARLARRKMLRTREHGGEEGEDLP
jgi:predicted metal-dependent phosphoesterase TrpH